MTNFFTRLEPLELSLASKLWQVTFSASLAGNQTTYLQIKTGSASPLISSYFVQSSAEPLKVTALESPTVTDGTVAVTPYNLNRTSTAAPTTLFYSNPTSISSGSPIAVDIVTAGKGAGASAESHGAWKLKPSTSYVWKIEQLTNQATEVVGAIVFSEGYGQF
jgi:hypothetical protein